MNCTNCEERISLHAGGDLPNGEAIEVERHLGECAGCQVLWAGLRESLETLRAAHVAQHDTLAPAHFTAVRGRVLAELEQSRRRWRRWLWTGALGAAALAVVFGVALFPGKAPPMPQVARVTPPVVRPQDPVYVEQPPAAAQGSALSRAQGAPRKGAVVAHPRRAGKRVRVAPASRQRPSLTVKLQTSDPNIVIYWIAD